LLPEFHRLIIPIFFYYFHPPPAANKNQVYQLSVISYQLSVISYQLSVISYQLSVISYQNVGWVSCFNPTPAHVTLPLTHPTNNCASLLKCAVCIKWAVLNSSFLLSFYCSLFTDYCLLLTDYCSLLTEKSPIPDNSTNAVDRTFLGFMVSSHQNFCQKTKTE